MLPNISETGGVRRDSRSATVAMATGGGATGEQDPVDDVVEYEEGFKMVEKYNISVSGNGYYTFRVLLNLSPLLPHLLPSLLLQCLPVPLPRQAVDE